MNKQKALKKVHDTICPICGRTSDKYIEADNPTYICECNNCGATLTFSEDGDLIEAEEED